MSKKKSKNKITIKRILKRFDNPIVRKWATTLYESNPIYFSDLMRDIFGKDDGQKIIDKVDADAFNAGDNIPLSMVAPHEYIPEGKVSWRDIVEGCPSGRLYVDSDEENHAFHYLTPGIKTYIDNDALKSLWVQLEFRSPYYNASKSMNLSYATLTEATSSVALKEILYVAIYEQLDSAVRDIEDMLDSDDVLLPDRIFEDYHHFANVYHCSGYTGVVNNLTATVYNIMSMLIATIDGKAIKPYEYTPEFGYNFLETVGASTFEVGVHIVQLGYVREQDDKEDSIEFRSVYPPKTPIEFTAEMLEEISTKKYVTTPEQETTESETDDEDLLLEKVESNADVQETIDSSTAPTDSVESAEDNE